MVIYIVSHPEANYHRYRRLCGINTTRAVSEFRSMGTKERTFDSLEDAQEYIASEMDESNNYRTRIPTNPQVGKEWREMRQRTLFRSEFTITVEGA